MLFFLSFLIYLFKYINPWVAKREQKKGGQQKPAAEAAMAPRVERQQEDVTDDTELVAVITAAIAALEQTPADSFVVRSVKKSIETTGREHRRIRYEKLYDHCKRKCVMSLWRNAQTVRQLPRSRQRLQRQKSGCPACGKTGRRIGRCRSDHGFCSGKVFKVEASAGQSVKAGIRS